MKEYYTPASDWQVEERQRADLCTKWKCHRRGGRGLYVHKEKRQRRDRIGISKSKNQNAKIQIKYKKGIQEAIKFFRHGLTRMDTGRNGIEGIGNIVLWKN